MESDDYLNYSAEDELIEGDCLGLDEEYIIDAYSDSLIDEPIKQRVVQTVQTTTIKYGIQIRLKATNYEEMVKSFEYYLSLMSVFSQKEALEMKDVFFSFIDKIDYQQYSIIIPVFFIYSYCSTKKICFSKSFKRSITEEVYIKSVCNKAMIKYIKMFCELLNFKDVITWKYYVNGMMLIVRQIITNLGSDYGVVTEDDNYFLGGANTSLKKISDEIQKYSYRLLVIGLMKYNMFNSSDLDIIFDLHIKALLKVLRYNSKVIPVAILDLLDERYKDQLLNVKLYNKFAIELEFYNNSIIETTCVKL